MAISAPALLVRIVHIPFDTMELVSTIVSVAGVLVAISIAIYTQIHDTRQRASQRTHDADERAKDRAAAAELQRQRQVEEQRQRDLEQARNIVGGAPRRLRQYAGQAGELPSDATEVMGPVVINASDSVISDVRLLGAQCPLSSWSVGGGRQVWYHRRRMADGITALILPHDEVEFVATWLEELDDPTLDPWTPPAYSRIDGVTIEMITRLEVAMEWTDSRGQRWVRLGHAEPLLRSEFSDEKIAALEREWMPRYNPDTG